MSSSTRCHIPGCRAYAMRGHTVCRAHRDHELGPRGAGAPPGNLNALKHGRHSQPLPLSALVSIADRIIDQPGDIHAALHPAVQSILARACRDPLIALIALRRVLAHLTTIVATRAFATELQALLLALPEPARIRARSVVQRRVRHLKPEERVRILRKAKKQLMHRFN